MQDSPVVALNAERMCIRLGIKREDLDREIRACRIIPDYFIDGEPQWCPQTALHYDFVYEGKRRKAEQRQRFNEAFDLPDAEISPALPPVKDHLPGGLAPVASSPIWARSTAWWLSQKCGGWDE